MTRYESRAERLREQGVEPVVCDAFDADGVARAVATARPEVVVNQLTDIPDAINPRKMAEQFETNDRLRTEGTRNLMHAAEAAGARRLISQSIALAYAPTEALWAEDDRLLAEAPEPWGRSVGAVQRARGGDARERQRGGRRAALRALLRARDGVRGRRLDGRDGPQAGVPAGRRRHRRLLVHPRRRRGERDGRGARPRRSRHLQRGRRRPGDGAASGCLHTPTRSTPAPPRRVPRFIARLVAGKFGRLHDDRSYRERRTPRRSASSAGSRAGRAGARASGRRSADVTPPPRRRRRRGGGRRGPALDQPLPRLVRRRRPRLQRLDPLRGDRPPARRDRPDRDFDVPQPQRHRAAAAAGAAPAARARPHSC